MLVVGGVATGKAMETVCNGGCSDQPCVLRTLPLPNPEVGSALLCVSRWEVANPRSIMDADR